MKLSTTSSVKFLRLKRRLGKSKWEVLGLLEAVVHFAIGNAPQSDLGKHSNEDICAYLEWEGDPDFLVQQLVESGWLDPHPVCRFIIHDWADHAPRYLKGNLARHGKEIVRPSAEQLAKELTKEPAIAGSSSNLPSSLVLSCLVLSCLALPSLGNEDLAPSPNSSDSEPELASLSSQATKSKSKSEPKADPTNIGEVVMTFPVVGDAERPTWDLRQGFVDEFQADFPGIDVLDHFRAALRWAKNNERKRKTAKGMREFLHRWIERNLSSPRGSPRAVPRESKEELHRRLFGGVS